MEDPSNPLIGEEIEAADKDGFSLIDGSELEDLFISMSEPRLMDNTANTVDGGVNPLERPETEKLRKNEKYNLRKSLAWDSAFFTSAGVLDAEELSSIIEGGNDVKYQMQRLPGIQEDISKSTDSLSTLESDNLTLESLEADLFSDIRASIQRSGESSKLRKSNLNGRPEETSQLGKRTTETKHGVTVKPKSTLKKLNTNLQGDGKLMKLGPSCEQVRKPVGSRREPSSSCLKLAAASGKGTSTMMAPAKVPTKRMSISAGRVQSDNNNVRNDAAAGRMFNVSKVGRAGDYRSIIPKATSHVISSSSLTSTRTAMSSARSSYDSTSSSSSQSSRILPLNGLPGKTNRPMSIPPAVKSRIPSRVLQKVKKPPSTSRISTKLSATLLTPSVSPTSSISEWSSCSSTVTANQEHSVSKNCSNLRRTFSEDSIASQDLQIHHTQPASCENEIEVAGEPAISAEDLSAGKATVSNPVSTKPSGLRMPSPKIGFFDGAKSGGRTQNAVGSTHSRSRLSSSRLTRSTTGSSSPSGIPNKGRIGHATAKAAANSNPDTQRINARMTATDGGRLEGILAATEEPNVRAREVGTKTTLLKTNDENNSTVAKLPAGEKHHSDSGSSSRKKNGLVIPAKNATPEEKCHFLGNQEISRAVEAERHMMGMNDDSKVLNTQFNGDIVNSEHQPVDMFEEVRIAIKVDENTDALILNGGFKATNEKNLPICAVLTDQQNAFTEQQVNGLILNVGAVDDKRGLCNEMHGKLGPHRNVNSDSDSHSPVLSCTLELSGSNQKEEAADFLKQMNLSGFIQKGEAADLCKQTDFSVSSKVPDSNPGSRAPFADKNSVPGAYAVEVLVKRFTSLSLDNVQGKEVEQ